MKPNLPASAKTLPTVQVALAVIRQRGRYLICRRRSHAHLGGYWEFPGGKRRPGESWEACAHRELREEVGVAVRVMGRLMRLRYRFADRAVVFTVLRCAIVSGRPKPLAADSLQWVTLSQLSRYRFPPANRSLLAYLRNTSKNA